MAHMAFGHIQEFDPNVEGISSYLERMGLYFVANKIESERQVAVFLSLIGGKNYALLRDLLLPQQLKDVSLVELMGTLRRHWHLCSFPPHFIIRLTVSYHLRYHEYISNNTIRINLHLIKCPNMCYEVMKATSQSLSPHKFR